MSDDDGEARVDRVARERDEGDEEDEVADDEENTPDSQDEFSWNDDWLGRASAAAHITTVATEAIASNLNFIGSTFLT